MRYFLSSLATYSDGAVSVQEVPNACLASFPVILGSSFALYLPLLCTVTGLVEVGVLGETGGGGLVPSCCPCTVALSVLTASPTFLIISAIMPLSLSFTLGSLIASCKACSASSLDFVCNIILSILCLSNLFCTTSNPSVLFIALAIFSLKEDHSFALSIVSLYFARVSIPAGASSDSVKYLSLSAGRVLTMVKSSSLISSSFRLGAFSSNSTQLFRASPSRWLMEFIVLNIK